jgi:iron(III) transport system substrate-binding protein
MRTLKAAAALGIVSALALAGCASAEPETPHEHGSLEFSAADVEALGGQENVDYLVELYDEAIEAGQTTITVYGITATSSASLYEAFSERFPGITVEHVTIFGLELQNRIASEQATGQYVVDNVSVGGADAVFVAENEFIAEQKPPLAAELPDSSKPKGDTLFGANSYLYTVSYNTDLVDESEAPRTFEDLLDPKWNGKIAVGDILTGVYGLTLGGINAGVIDESWVEDFAATDPVVVPSERDVFTAVSTGQVPIGLNNYIRGEQFLQTDNLPVAFVADFEDGIGDGVYYRGTVVNAPNALASDLLVAWWLTPEAMELLSIQGQAGLMPGAPAVAGQPPLSEIKINPAPGLDEYTEKTRDVLDMFTKAFS